MISQITGKPGSGRTNHKIRSFLHDQRGNIAIMTAFLLPTTVLSVGVAVDYSTIYLAKSDLQQMADASVMAAAREMVLINKTSDGATSVAKSFVAAHMKTGKSKFGKISNISVKPDTKNNFLTISITALKKNAFGGFLQPEYTILKATAKAKALAGVNICAIALETTESSIIQLKDNSEIIGNNCAVYSNSTAVHGIELVKNSKLQAGLVCSAGGIKKTERARADNLVTDCPPVDDPLAGRPAPVAGNCDYTNFSKKDYAGNIWPGTYCGGLKIDGRSVVNFIPGIYIIKDGKLELKDSTVANGGYAGFYFTGINSGLKIERKTTVEFVAPRGGLMAGMLFYQNPASGNNVFEIHSDNARTLLGTIYLPMGILSVKSTNPVADRSAFTVIITKKMVFEGNTQLVLNTDYSATDVPVPKGVRGQNAKVYLAK
jgi:hypothetical protein